MPDNFACLSGGLEAPATILEAATYDTEFTSWPRALWIGAAGNVSVKTMAGTDVVLNNVAGGTLLPIRCKQINSASTTVPAGNIVGLS